MPKRPVPVSNVALGRCKRTGERFFKLDRPSVGVNPLRDRIPRTIRFKDPDTEKLTSRQVIPPALIGLKPNRTAGQRKGRPWTGTTNVGLVTDPNYLPPLPKIPVKPVPQEVFVGEKGHGRSASITAASPERRAAAAKCAALLFKDLQKCKSAKKSAKIRSELNRLLDLAGIPKMLPNGAMAAPGCSIWKSVEIKDDVGPLGKRHATVKPLSIEIVHGASGTGLGVKD